MDVHSDKVLDFNVDFLDYKSFLQLFREIFIKRTYYFESDNDSPSIIDCGANIGMTIIFFKRLYPNAKIKAFEPNKEIFKILKKNVDGLQDVKVMNKAVFDVEGEVTMYYEPKLSLRSSLIKNVSGLLKKCNVEATRLSNHVKSEVDFLKMDIEGAEVKVIKELINNDKLKLIKEMAVECHHLTPEKSTFKDFINIVEKYNYSTSKVGNIVWAKQNRK